MATQSGASELTSSENIAFSWDSPQFTEKELSVFLGNTGYRNDGSFETSLQSPEAVFQSLDDQQNMMVSEAPGEAEPQTEDLASTGGDLNCDVLPRHEAEPPQVEDQQDFPSSGEFVSCSGAGLVAKEQHLQENHSPSQAPGPSLEGIQSLAAEIPPGASSKNEVSPTTGEVAGADGTQKIVSARSSSLSKGKGKKNSSTPNKLGTECQTKSKNFSTDEMIKVHEGMMECAEEGIRPSLSNVDVSARVCARLKADGIVRDPDSLKHNWNNQVRYKRMVEESARASGLDVNNLLVVSYTSKIRKEKGLPPPCFTLEVYKGVSYLQNLKTTMKDEKYSQKKRKRMDDAGASEPSGPSSCPNTSTILSRGVTFSIPSSSGIGDPGSEINNHLVEMLAVNANLPKIRCREQNTQKQIIQVGEDNTRDLAEKDALMDSELLEEVKGLQERKKEILKGLKDSALKETELRKELGKVNRRINEVEEKNPALFAD